MRRTLIPAAVLLCLAAEMRAQQAPVKLAVINLQGALVSTKDGKKASADLDAKVAPGKKEFDARQSELIQLQDQYA